MRRKRLAPRGNWRETAEPSYSGGDITGDEFAAPHGWARPSYPSRLAADDDKRAGTPSMSAMAMINSDSTQPV
jgi:hypothetical protein